MHKVRFIHLAPALLDKMVGISTADASPLSTPDQISVDASNSNLDQICRNVMSVVFFLTVLDSWLHSSYFPGRCRNLSVPTACCHKSCSLKIL